MLTKPQGFCLQFLSTIWIRKTTIESGARNAVSNTATSVHRNYIYFCVQNGTNYTFIKCYSLKVKLNPQIQDKIVKFDAKALHEYYFSQSRGCSDHYLPQIHDQTHLLFIFGTFQYQLVLFFFKFGFLLCSNNPQQLIFQTHRSDHEVYQRYLTKFYIIPSKRIAIKETESTRQRILGETFLSETISISETIVIILPWKTFYS